MSRGDFVLCLNCEELIPSVDTPHHSEHCDYVLPEVLFGSLAHTQFALRKFTRFLQEKEECRALLKVATRLESVDTAKQAKSALGELNQIVDVPSMFFLVAQQRLKVLAKDLIFYLDQAHIRRKRTEIELMKQEIEHYKRKSLMYQEQLTGEDRLSTAIKQIDSRPASPERSLNVSLDDGCEDLEDIVDEATSDSLKKYFYLKCIALKLTFKPSDKAQKVSVESLYREAVSCSIPVESWPDFIKQQLHSARAHSRGDSMARYKPPVVIQEESEETLANLNTLH